MSVSGDDCAGGVSAGRPARVSICHAGDDRKHW